MSRFRRYHYEDLDDHTGTCWAKDAREAAAEALRDRDERRDWVQPDTDTVTIWTRWGTWRAIVDVTALVDARSGWTGIYSVRSVWWMSRRERNRYFGVA